MLRLVFRLYSKVLSCIDRLINEKAKGRYKVRSYQGFQLVYSPGTSLIEHIRLGKEYEPEIINAFFREIDATKAAQVMDIGANIGLITLSCLSRYPKLKVYAFEPGQHQRELFKETIKINRLDDRVEIYAEALGKEAGRAPFAVHAAAHASGDGFLDTGRAGTSSNVTVDVTALDVWWKGKGRPDIPVVKIDVEGAEKWVLEGGEEFLSACRPTLIIEIWPENEKPYGYGCKDVFNLLTSLSYRLETVDGRQLTEANANEFWGKETTFIARYLS